MFPHIVVVRKKRLLRTFDCAGNHVLLVLLLYPETPVKYRRLVAVLVPGCECLQLRTVYVIKSKFRDLDKHTTVSVDLSPILPPN